MSAPGEVRWEEWMSTLTPLDSDSPLEPKTRPVPVKEEAIPVSESAGTTSNSEKMTSEEMTDEEKKVEEMIAVAGEEKRDERKEHAK